MRRTPSYSEPLAAPATRAMPRDLGAPRRGGRGGPSLERITAAIGVVFVVINLVVLSYYVPHPKLHSVLEHQKDGILRRARALRARLGAAGRLPFEPTDTFYLFERWLQRCSEEEARCSCVVHAADLSGEMDQIFERYPKVSFHVLAPAEMSKADSLADSVRARRLSNTVVLRRSLAPLANVVEGPDDTRPFNLTRLRSRSIAALHLAAESFELQLVHPSALSAGLASPSAHLAAAVLSLAGATLLMPPDQASLDAWRDAARAIGAAPAGARMHDDDFFHVDVPGAITELGGGCVDDEHAVGAPGPCALVYRVRSPESDARHRQRMQDLVLDLVMAPDVV